MGMGACLPKRGKISVKLLSEKTLGSKNVCLICGEEAISLPNYIKETKAYVLLDFWDVYTFHQQKSSGVFFCFFLINLWGTNWNPQNLEQEVEMMSLKHCIDQSDSICRIHTKSAL